MLAVGSSLRRAREARFPLIGLVENFCSVVCAKCGAEGPLFRETPVAEVAREFDLDVLARIPFDPDLAAAGDAGRSFLEGAGLESIAGRALTGLAARVDAYERPGPEGDTW